MSVIKCITLEEELEKHAKLTISDIKILREWCEAQPHLPKIKDVQLAFFLHTSYYHMKRAKKLIENYYTYRTVLPELFSNRDIMKVEQLRKIYDVIATIQLEAKTKEGYSIFLGRLLDTNPSHFSLENGIKSTLMVHDQFLSTHGTTRGYIYVIDATGVSFGHIFRMKLTLIKKVAYYIQEALPMRLKAIHVINTSRLIEIVYNMTKPFINAELLEEIRFHSNMESVNEYLPIDILPNEFGGKAGPIKEFMDLQVKKIKDFREWFLEDEITNRVNESLRKRESST